MIVQYFSLLTTFLYATTFIRYASHTAIRHSAHNGDLQTATIRFTRNASSHKTDWITTGCLHFLALLYLHKWSICWSFLKWKFRGFAFSRILLRLHFCLRIVYTLLVFAFAYLAIPFSLMLVVVGLLGTSSIYLLVYHLFIYFRSNILTFYYHFNEINVENVQHNAAWFFKVKIKYFMSA